MSIDNQIQVMPADRHASYWISIISKVHGKNVTVPLRPAFAEAASRRQVKRFGVQASVRVRGNRIFSIPFLKALEFDVGIFRPDEGKDLAEGFIVSHAE